MPPRTIDVFAYYIGVVRAGRAYANLVENSSLLTEIGIFNYDITPEGGLTGETNRDLIAEAQSYGVAVSAVITNFVGGQFSPELAHTIFVDPELRGRLIEAITTLATTNNYNGINLDIENVFPADRSLFTNFVRELSSRLRPLGITLSMAVPAKTGDFPERDWIGAFDYGALAALTDFLMLMTYEYHWAGGEPGPIAPIPWMREVLTYALSEIPPGQVLLGIPLHGYDWIVPPPPGAFASAVSPWRANELSQRYGAPQQWDAEAEEPYFFYNDGSAEHEVWFQNPNSLAAKMELVNEYNLRGLGLWPLSMTFPEFWSLLAGMFTVRQG